MRVGEEETGTMGLLYHRLCASNPKVFRIVLTKAILRNDRSEPPAAHAWF
jgi:hypothetical protein